MGLERRKWVPRAIKTSHPKRSSHALHRAPPLPPHTTKPSVTHAALTINPNSTPPRRNAHDTPPLAGHRHVPGSCSRHRLTTSASDYGKFGSPPHYRNAATYLASHQMATLLPSETARTLYPPRRPYCLQPIRRRPHPHHCQHRAATNALSTAAAHRSQMLQCPVPTRESRTLARFINAMYGTTAPPPFVPASSRTALRTDGRIQQAHAAGMPPLAAGHSTCHR